MCRFLYESIKLEVAVYGHKEENANQSNFDHLLSLRHHLEHYSDPGYCRFSGRAHRFDTAYFLRYCVVCVRCDLDDPLPKREKGKRSSFVTKSLPCVRGGGKNL